MSNEKQLTVTDMQNIAANVEKKLTRERMDAIYALRDAQIHNGYAKMARCATIRLLAEIKERKLFKDLEFVDIDGNWRKCETWDEFCPAFTGQARRTIDEQIDQLKVLGEELFEFNEKFKFINRSAFRDYKQIDASERQMVIDIVSKPEKTPEEVIEAFEQLMEKNAIAKQKLEQANAELKTKLEDVSGDLESSRKLAAEKDKRINEQQEQMERERRKRFEADPVDIGEEITLAMGTHVAQALSEVYQMRQVCEELIAHGAEHGMDHTPAMVGSINQIIRAAESLRETFALPREAPTDEIPAWLKAVQAEQANDTNPSDQA